VKESDSKKKSAKQVATLSRDRDIVIVFLPPASIIVSHGAA